ncbi:MAG: hypothetical protein ABWX83_01580 [Luteibacter sp.]
MTKKRLSAIGAGENGLARAPSKTQKAFNALIAKIEERRATLAEWEAFGIDFRRRFTDEYLPLRQAFDAARIRLVNRLDLAHDDRSLTKGERQTIVALILRFAGDLLASANDPEVAEVYRRYGGVDARESPVEPEAAKRPADRPPAGDALDPEEARERARQEYHAKRKRAAPKRDAAEERARVEEAEVHLSIREVYRKLASALHPDRERDEVERLRKAGLMQRVNTAYASRSLLDLLEIQLELEHIDQATLDSINEGRLKRWNAILKEQLRGLDQELGDVEDEYRDRCSIPPSESVSPRAVKRVLTSDMAHFRESTRAFERDLRVFDDVDRMTSWLKAMKAQLDD